MSLTCTLDNAAQLQSSIYAVFTNVEFHNNKKFNLMKQCALICILIFLCLSGHAQLTYNELFVQYDSAWTYKNLQLIPVRFKSPGSGTMLPNTGTINFSEALKTGKISVHELNNPEGADINTLYIKNHSKKNILINSGEMLEGGKQDRASAVTAIIPSEEEYYLPVFCIEKGRWNNKARTFNYAGSTDASLKKQIDVTQKQNEIWKDISARFEDKGITSDTWPYLKIYRDTSDADTSYMNYFINRFKNSDSSFAGFIAVTDNHIINCELFATTELCMLSYEGLLNSYIRSVRNKEEEETSVEKKEIIEFTDLFMKSVKQQQQYIATHGRIDKHDDKIIHLVAYP